MTEVIQDVEVKRPDVQVNKSGKGILIFGFLFVGVALFIFGYVVGRKVSN